MDRTMGHAQAAASSTNDVGPGPARRTGHRVGVRSRPGWRPDLPLWAALVLGAPMIAAFAFLVFYPAVELVTTSLAPGLEGFSQLFQGTELDAIRTTISISFLVTILCLLLGAVVAWSLHTLRSRFLSALFWIAILGSMSTSVVVKNYAFIIILGKFGLVNAVFDALGLSRQDILFTSTAVTAGMVYSLLPLAVFPLYFTFRSVPIDLLHAAASLGGTWSQTMRTVVLPLSVPGFFITGVVVFVFSIGFFVTPVVLGGSESTFLASMIQQDILQTFDRTAAATKSVFLIVVALVLVAVAVKLVGKERFERALG